jgi:hypothetical protein
MATIAGWKGAVYLSSTTATPFTGAATSADDAYKVYTVTDKPYLDPGTAIKVKRGGVEVNKTEYQVAYAGGKIEFQNAQESTDVITVDGATLTAAEFGECREWSLDIEQDLEETTTFGNEFKTFQSLLRGASGSFSRWHYPDTTHWFITRINAETPLLLVLYLDAEHATVNSRFEVTARLTSEGVTAAQSGFVEESISFQVTGPINYTTIAKPA